MLYACTMLQTVAAVGSLHNNDTLMLLPLPLPQAAASVELHREQAAPIRLSDVQGLVLWVLGQGALNPRWCFVKACHMLCCAMLCCTGRRPPGAVWESG